MQTFLGRGWSFPPAFSRINNAVQMVTDIHDIQESLHLILGTIPGERIMQPEFGSNIHRLVFDPVDSTFISEANDIISRALLHFEPRINFLSAEISHWNEMEGAVYLRIHFSVIVTNTRHNIVYPFYIDEGTSITDSK
jgi:phage baseplate assembly protein W